MTPTTGSGLPGSPHPDLHFSASCGAIEGWRDGNLIRATGIPYATAARFARPEPVHRVEDSAPYPGQEPSAPGEPFCATEFAPCAPQADDPALTEIFGLQRRDLGVSEDCLRLSITRPADMAPGEKLPVMVWIHGGSYVSGCGDSSVTDPAGLVREQRVIVVTVTYRMGILGFLSSAHAPGNLGLFDQIEAFRWVRRNIAAFGGDPAQVTAFGESAGADAICHLMVAMGHELRQAEGEGDAPAAAEKEDGSAGAGSGAAAELLFDRAILMSPPLGIRHNRSRMNAVMSAFVEPQITDGMSTRAIVGLQQKASAKVSHFGLPGMMPFGTEYGHAPLPEERDVEASWRAIASHVPIMIGTLATEASLFAHTMPAARALHRIPVVGEQAYWTLVAATSTIVFTKPASDFARLWRDAGGSAHRFSIPWSVPGNPIRSPHALDMALLFARQDSWREVVPFRGATWPEVRRAATDLRRYFGEFARFETLAPFTRDPRVVRSS